MRWQSVESYAAELFRTGCSYGRSFAGILGPFGNKVHSSEIPAAELDGLLESTRNECMKLNQGKVRL